MFVPGVKIPLPLPPEPFPEAPSGSAWVHEIKHDGYRLIARREGGRVRLYTRRGYDWSGKYLRIVEALRSLRVRSIIVDGEAVWAGEDGKSDFDKLHSRAHDQQVFLYAFDLLGLNGEDYRQVSLERRKAKLKKFSRGPRGCDFRSTWTEMARRFQARLQNGVGRYRFEAARFCLSKRPMQKLGEGQKSEFACRAAHPGRQLVT
jgi:ATP-dependent DNA ligase